ncbi:hypothetical protein C3L33_18123, partial [Rhododendron williamsianum]
MVIQVAVSRGLNGKGLAIVIPSIQSIVADLTDETNRGTAFGVIVGVLVRLFANDPRFDDGEAKAQIPRKSFCAEVKDMITEAKSVIKIPSFQIIVAQGVAGSFPWNALSFAPIWLELIGFSHKKVAFLWTLFSIAVSLDGLFGGKMGDILGQRYPNSGRIILSQISSGSAIPLAAILLLVLPDDPSTAFMHGTVGIQRTRLVTYFLEIISPFPLG